MRGVGDNLPPAVDPERLAAATAAVSEWTDAAAEWLRKGVQSESDAQLLTDAISGARGVLAKIESTRKAEKDPFLKAGRDVDAAYSRLIGAMEESIRQLRALATKWMGVKKARADAERMSRLAENNQKLTDAQAALNAARWRGDTMGQVAALEDIKDAQKEVEAAESPVNIQIGSASGGGRTLSYRTYREVEIYHYGLAFSALKNDTSVKEAVQRALNNMVRSKNWDGVPPPGCKVIERQEAV